MVRISGLVKADDLYRHGIEPLYFIATPGNGQLPDHFNRGDHVRRGAIARWPSVILAGRNRADPSKIADNFPKRTMYWSKMHGNSRMSGLFLRRTTSYVELASPPLRYIPFKQGSLMTRVSHLLSGASALGLLSLPMAASAQSTGPDVSFYGQLNLGFVNVDNGATSDTAFTDNDNSNSRVGVIYSQGLSNGGEFRLHFETGLGFTGSSQISQGDDDFDVEYRRTELRKFEAIYVTPAIGTFSFGQGSTATDGFGDNDLSGTGVIAGLSVSDIAASQEFQLAGGGASGVTIGDAFASFDGGRRFRVRYDTPSYNGFGFSVSAGEEVLSSGNDEEYYDVGLSYDQDYGDMTVAGGLGYSIRGSNEELMLASVAVLHNPTGWNAALATGKQQEGDANYVYAKIGLRQDWFSLGETRLSVDYYDGDDFVAAGSQSKSVGLSAVQVVDRYNMEVYATYRSFDVDDAGAALLDQDVTFVGARWRF